MTTYGRERKIFMSSENKTGRLTKTPKLSLQERERETERERERERDKMKKDSEFK